MDKEAQKKAAAAAALRHIKFGSIVGVGTGSTANYFIEALATIKNKIDLTVPSSQATMHKLKALNLPVAELNTVNKIDVYVDGADEVNQHQQMIKGGGGALTREKIVASAAEKFICIVDESKVVDLLGKFPVAVEVLEMARSFVARQLVKLGGDPQYRERFKTDNGNIILDVYNLDFTNPLMLEQKIKQIPGVIENGIFAARHADLVIVGKSGGVEEL